VKRQRIALALTASFHEYLVKNRVMAEEEKEFVKDELAPILEKLVKLIQNKDPKITVTINKGGNVPHLQIEDVDYNTGRVSQVYIFVQLLHNNVNIFNQTMISPSTKLYESNVNFKWPDIPYNEVVDHAFSILKKTQPVDIKWLKTFKGKGKTASVKKWQTAQNAAKAAWDRR